MPPVTQLLAFIREHAETLPSTATSTQPSSEKPGENSAKKTPRKSDRNQDYQSSKPRSNVYTVSPAPSYKWECALCRPEKHPLHSCPKWAAYDVTRRLGHIRAKSLCSNCLAGGHATSACKSTYRCRECGQAHHTTIHQQPAAVITSINSSTVQSHQVPDALMTTAQDILIGPKGQELKARALIDSGAGLSLVSKRVTQLLDLPLEPSNLQFSAVQGAPCKPSNYLTSLLISPLQNKEKQILCKPAVVQMVTCDLPPEPIQPVTDLPHIMGLELADVTYHIPGRIDILLGADLAPQIMVKRLLRSGADSEPIAQATQFGWAISGPIRRKNSSTPPIPTHHHLVQPSDPRLDHLCLLSQLWKTEQPEEEASSSLVEEQIQQRYSVNVTHSPSECRDQVTLPKKPEMQPLGDSKTHLDPNYAEPVPASEPFSSYYNSSDPPSAILPANLQISTQPSYQSNLPSLINSATTTSEISLKQTIRVGPNIQPTSQNILLNFPSYPIAWNADISKLYREVKLSPQDKELHRFIWRASPNLPAQDFRVTRVTSGVSASPYLAVRTTQQTAGDYGEDYPNVTNHIKNSLYINDFLGGVNTIQEIIEFFTNWRGVFLTGSFTLCKWRITSSEVLQSIHPELQEQYPLNNVTTPQAPSHPKALGLEWDSSQDNKSHSIVISGSYKPTKRWIISNVSRTCDILGWIPSAALSTIASTALSTVASTVLSTVLSAVLSAVLSTVLSAILSAVLSAITSTIPLTIPSTILSTIPSTIPLTVPSTVLSTKMLYQQLWQKGQELDEEVPPELTDLHARWRSKFPLLSPKRLPRFCNLLNHSNIKQELHAFSDDSLKSYGAVVYCRITYPDHPPAVSLITPEIESTHNISSNLHITLAISAWCLKFCDQISMTGLTQTPEISI